MESGVNSALDALQREEPKGGPQEGLRAPRQHDEHEANEFADDDIATGRAEVRHARRAEHEANEFAHRCRNPACGARVCVTSLEESRQLRQNRAVAEDRQQRYHQPAEDSRDYTAADKNKREEAEGSAEEATEESGFARASATGCARCSVRLCTVCSLEHSATIDCGRARLMPRCPTCGAVSTWYGSCLFKSLANYYCPRCGPWPHPYATSRAILFGVVALGILIAPVCFAVLLLLMCRRIGRS